MEEEKRKILNKWIAMEAINKLPKIVTPACLKDKEFILEILHTLKLNFALLEFVSPSLKKDPEVVIAALDNNTSNMRFMDKSLYNNKEVVIRIVTIKPEYIKYASDKLKGDKEVMMVVVKGHLGGDCICYASKKLKADRELVIEAMKTNGWAFHFIDEKFCDDREIAMISPGRALDTGRCSSRLASDREFVKAAVIERPTSYKYASEELKHDKEILILALDINGKVFFDFTPEEERLPYDETIRTKDRGDLFPYTMAPRELQLDKDVAIAAVQKVTFAYTYILPEMRKDKDVFLEAFKVNRLAIEYAPRSMFEDEEFARKVMEIDPLYSNYLPYSLKDNKEYMMYLISKKVSVYSSATTRVKTDPDVILLVAHKDIGILNGDANVYRKDNQYILHYHFDAEKNRRAGAIINAFSGMMGKEFQKETKEVGNKLIEEAEFGDVTLDLVADEEVALDAAIKNMIEPSILKDRDFALKLVSTRKDGYGKIAQELKADREIIYAAVRCNYYNFRIVPTIYQADKELFLIALEKAEDYTILSCAAPAIQDDKEIVLLAVRNNYGNLSYASSRLKDDEEVVIEAIKNDGAAIRYASDRLKGDLEIAKMAVNNTTQYIWNVIPRKIVNRIKKEQ